MNRKIIGLALLTVLVIGSIFAVGCIQSSREKTKSETSSIAESSTPETERTTTEETQTQEAKTQNDAESGEDVPGNTENAYLLTAGTYKGTLEEGDDADVYVVKLGPNDVLRITLIPSAGLDVGLGHCASGETVDVLSSYVENRGMKGEKEIYLRIPNRKLNYYIAAIRESGSGTYELKLEVLKQNDADSGADAPGDTDDAVQLTPGTYKGFLGQDDNADSYFLKIGPADIVAINVTPSSEFDVVLWTGVDDLWAHDNGLKGEPETEHFVNEEKDNTYYIVVTAKNDEDIGSYTLSTSVTKQNDAGSGADAPEGSDDAVLINMGTYKGYVGQNDARDFYVLKIGAGDIVKVKVTPSSDLDVMVAAAANADNLYFGFDNGLKGEPESVTYTADEDTINYYIGVRYKGGAYAGNYTLKISISNP
ncbi:hypothetical protein [Thermococcus sp.]